MINKYNTKRAKLHFKRLLIIEKISIFTERLFLKIKDNFRFFKMDKSIIIETIKELFYIALCILIINTLSDKLLVNDSFRNLKFISGILDSIVFIVKDYNQYLLACLGVGGFLVALFLSNLSGIITAKYINIVSKVSLSVLNEYANKKYLKSMINYLSLIIVQLGCLIFDINISPAIALISVFLTIRITIIYFELAQRVFLFSDINMLTKTIYQEINIRFMYLQKAIKKNKTDSIFNSYGNQIIDLMDTLKSLQKEMIKEEKSDDITEFTNYIIAIIVRYSEFKNLIPIDSKWYRLKYDPVNWFEADFFEVNLRTQTGTSLNNKPITNNYFLEEYISDLYTLSIEYLIEHNMNEELYKVINNYYLCLDAILTNCGDFTYWIKFNENIENLVINSELIEDVNYEAIVDFFSLNRVNIVLNAQKYILKTYNDYFKNIPSKLGSFLLKKSKNNILFTDDNVVKFTEKLKYEKEIEKKIITSNKYIYEFLIFHFVKKMTSIVGQIEANYDAACLQAKKLRDKHYNLSSCLFYSRIIELENKSIATMEEISSIYKKLISYQYNIELDKLCIENLLAKINRNHYSNLIEYAQTFLISDECDYKNSKIDFCGEIFYNFSESIFETILNNDFNNFEKIYQCFLSICFKAESFLYDNLDKKYNLNYLISKYKIPIITLMDISGCAIYHSHIIGDKKWENKVKSVFFNAMSKLDNKHEIFKKMALYASIDISSFDMNEMVINIRQRYSRYLSSNNIIKIKECRGSFYFNKEIDSDDELIKKFTQLGFDDYIDFYYKFYEIFIVYCINPELEDKDKYDCRLKLNETGDRNGK